MIRLKITGMTCQHCAVTVKGALESVEGVESAEVYFPQGYAEVKTSGDVSLEDLIEAVKESGYGAEPLEEEAGFYISKGKVYDLCIVGGGSAGFAGAIRAVELGAEKILIAEERVIGGTCLNRGCIPSKYFIETARVLFTPRSNPFGAVSLPEGTLDFKGVVDLKRELLKDLRKEKYWNVLEAYPQIEYVEERGEFSGRDMVVVGDRDIPFHRALISTGSRPFVPPIEGIESVPYLTSDTIFDLEELPEHLLIIGGGAIGLELGQAFLRFGAKVSVIEAMEDIALSEEPEIRKRLRGILEKEGMEIHTSAVAKGVTKVGDRIRIKVNKENEEFELEGSHLLVAVGRRANTERLGLDKAGVEVDERGFVKVNDSLQTTNEAIYGAGDCIDRALLVTLSAVEGGTAVENALLGKEKSVDYLSVPHAIFTDPEVASVGLTEEEAKRRGYRVDTRVLEFSKVPRAVISLRTEGLVKMVVEEGSLKILGVHILAPHGAEVIHRVVPLVKLGLGVRELMDMVDVYPTLSESVKLCAQTFFKDVSKLSCCAQ